MPSGRVKTQVLIIGIDPNAERLETTIAAGGARARRVGTDNAMAVVIANCPELTVLLGEAARDGGADFCDALGHDVRTGGLDVLIVTASEPPPEVTLNRHAAVVSPDLAPTRLAPLVLGLLQWGDPVGPDGRPLSLSHRVEALLHILEQRLVGQNRTSSQRYSRAPLRSIPARVNTPRASRPTAAARKTPVVTFREQDQEPALDRMSIPARASANPRADTTPVSVPISGDAMSNPGSPPSRDSGTDAKTEAAQGPAPEPRFDAVAVAPVSVVAEAIDLVPARDDDVFSPADPADVVGPEADLFSSGSVAPASAASVSVGPKSQRPPSSVPPPLPRSAPPAARSRVPDWWARGVGALALIASIAVLYQQTREEPPPAVARIVVPEPSQPPAEKSAPLEPRGAVQSPVQPAAPTAGSEAPPESDQVSDQAPDPPDRGAAHPGFEERLAEANSLIDEGLYYERQKNFRVAATRYQQALELAPSYARALRASVRASMQLHDKNEAIAAAERLVKYHPTEAAHFLLLGDAYDRAGATERAKQAWRAAADSGNATARSRLARAERAAAPTSGTAAPRAAAVP